MLSKKKGENVWAKPAIATEEKPEEKKKQQQQQQQQQQSEKPQPSSATSTPSRVDVSEAPGKKPPTANSILPPSVHVQR